MKHFYASLFYLMLFNTCFAQNNIFEYTLDRTNDDQFIGSYEDAEGNILLTSLSINTVEPRWMITKLDKLGNLLHQNALDSGYSFTTWSDILPIDDNHFLVTSQYDTVGRTYIPALIKYDKDLNIIGRKKLDFKSKAIIQQMKYSRNGNFFIATGIMISSDSTFIATFNLQGDSLETHTYKENPYPSSFSDFLELPNETGFYIFKQGVNSKGTPIAKEDRAQLIKLNRNFSLDTSLYLETSLTLPGQSDPVYFKSVITAEWISDDSFMLGGIVFNNVNVTGDKNDDAGIMIMDTNFNELTYTIFGRSDTNETDNGNRILSHYDSSAFFLGMTGNYQQFSPHTGRSYIYVIKTDHMGKHIWSRLFNKDRQLLVNDILATADGGALVCGFSYKEIAGNQEEMNAYAIKLDSNGRLVGIFENLPKDETNITFFPNPFHSELWVQSDLLTVSFLQISDITGKIVYSGSLTSPSTALHLEKEKSGFYFYKITNQDGKMATGKLIKYE